jgi:hypothetical protein
MKRGTNTFARTRKTKLAKIGPTGNGVGAEDGFLARGQRNKELVGNRPYFPHAIPRREEENVHSPK